MSTNVFHEGELKLQGIAATLEKAQRLGKSKISSQIHLESVDFVRNRHSAYISSIDPDTQQVWCSVIFADPKDLPKDKDTSPIPDTPCAKPDHPTIPVVVLNEHEQKRQVKRQKSLLSQGTRDDPYCDSCGDFSAREELIPYFQSTSRFEPFVRVDSPEYVTILKPPHESDPLWKNGSIVGAPISINFLEYETRKRYRVNGTIACAISKEGFCFKVAEAFSICPRYIQLRTVSAVLSHPTEAKILRSEENNPKLPESFIDFITASDTFFIASVHPVRGADASHRGGRPGFVRVIDGTKLAWGDYHGKGMYQTLGNTIQNDSVGVSFIDFERGHVLQISGKITLDWKGDYGSIDGSTMLVTLDICNWIYYEYYCPYKWDLISFSTHHPLLEDKPFLQDLAKEKLYSSIEKWRSLGEQQCVRAKLVSATTVAPDVKSFWFECLDGKRLVYQPGQYSTFTVPINGNGYIRCWTLSSAYATYVLGLNAPPENEKEGAEIFEITVKRVPNGFVTGYLHDEIKLGSVIVCHGVEGHFTLESSQIILGRASGLDYFYNRDEQDNASPRKKWWKVLLLSGGVGVTPMLSMIRGVEKMFNEGRIHRVAMPDLAFVHSEREVEGLFFADELMRWSETGITSVTAVAVTNTAEEKLIPSLYEKVGKKTKVTKGFVTLEFLQEAVPFLKDRMVYVCGPNAFMSAMSRNLQKGGVPASRIIIENFEY